MSEEKYTEIISTIEAAEIEPDANIENGCFKSILIECRICLEEYGPFIIPCRCDGTMKHVHQKCLKKWAAERMKRQVMKDEQKAKAKLSNIHGIECELCKESISMEVRKLKRLVGCSEAREGSEEYFLPFIPLVLFNALIFFGCLGGAFYIISFAMMLAFFKDEIDYDSYSEHLIMIWSLLGLGLTFCAVFMIKSVIELYYIFVREQYEIIKVIPNPLVMNTETGEVKVTQADCPNTQWFSTMEPLSTPTSPHSMAENLLQSKLSLTRKKMLLKKEMARESAERKLAKLKEFKANDSKDVKRNQQKNIHEQMTAQTTAETTSTAQNSMTNLAVKGLSRRQSADINC